MWSLHSLRSLAVVLASILVLSGPAAAFDLSEDPGTPASGPSAPDVDLAKSSPRDTPLMEGTMNGRQMIEDPEGDTEISILGEDVPPGDGDAPVDILSLHTAETETHLVFDLKHRGYPELEGTTSQYTISQAWCEVEFSVNGSGDRYGIILYYMMFLNEPYASWSYFYTRHDDGWAEWYDEAPSALVADDHYEMIARKDSIRVGASERSLMAGDKLTELTTSCWRNTPSLFISYEDHSEGTGSYPITIAPRTSEISLEMPEVGDAVGVPAGENTKLQVLVENLADRKLLVNITAEVVDEDGKPIPGWSVRSAATLEVRSNATTPATLMVSADPDAPHRSGGTLKVVAFPLGFEAKAILSKQIFASVTPSPEQDTLYFHWSPDAFDWCVGLCIGGGTDLPVQALSGQYNVFMMNVLQEDPEFSSSPKDSDTIRLFPYEPTFAMTDVPMGKPLRLDPEGFLELTTSLKTDLPGEYDLSVTIWLHEGWARTSKTVTLTDSFTEHTLLFPVTDEMIDVPRGGFIGLEIDVWERTTPISVTTGTTMGIDWNPGESRLTLPLVDVPSPKMNVTDGRALPTISIGNQSDREEYVNPGKSVAFDLWLTNEGTEKDTLRVTSKMSKQGWKVAFEPGNNYDLEVGKTAPVCVLVSAPADALEGDIANLTLTAASRLDEAVSTEIDLTLIVTDGVEFESEGCREVSEEEYVAPTLDDTKDSPIASPFWVLSLLALGLISRRRILLR